MDQKCVNSCNSVSMVLLFPSVCLCIFYYFNIFYNLCNCLNCILDVINVTNCVFDFINNINYKIYRRQYMHLLIEISEF